MLPFKWKGRQMGQPVKLSDELVDDARAVTSFSHRSIAGQIEFWASLGKSIEPLLRGDMAIALQMSGAERPLSAAIAEIDTRRGRKRLMNVLNARPFPHYLPIEGQPQLIRRIAEDGSETVGRFEGRDFVPVDGDRQHNQS